MPEVQQNQTVSRAVVNPYGGRGARLRCWGRRSRQDGPDGPVRGRAIVRRSVGSSRGSSTRPM